MFRRKNALLSVALCVAVVPGAALAGDNNNNGGPAPNAPVGSLALNAGRILCTAAINSNGTIATTLVGSFINPATTSRVGLGQYQVGFKGPCSNVQAINGWFRIVQRDTLGTGLLGAGSCAVADRAGNPAGIFVNCFNGTGGAADTSFTLSVSR
jgi:hypothetical protein